MAKLTDRQQKELDQLMDKFKQENISHVITLTDGRTQPFIPLEGRFTLDSRNVGDLKILLDELPPDKETYKWSGKESQTNMIVYIKNPIPGNHSYNHFSIYWKHQNVDVSIKFPIEFIEPFVTRTARGIYETEYGYYTGISTAELKRMTVPAYKFITQANVVGWYGGDQSTLNQCLIEEIVEHLLNPDEG